MPGSILKAQIRHRVWDLLTRTGIVRQPGAYGHTPVFRGVHEALARLESLSGWREAERVLVLREKVLTSVRKAGLEEGKTLLIPDLSRAEGWVLELDVAKLGREKALEIARACSEPDWNPPEEARFRMGRDVEPADLMIVGAVGVDFRGARVGKGVGEADLIYSLGRSRGFVTERTPVVVFVHDLQVIEEPGTSEPFDLPVDVVVTPRRTHPVQALRIRPKGVHPAMITPERLTTFPTLQRILTEDAPPLRELPQG